MAHYIFFENETYLTSVLSCRGFLKIKCQTQGSSPLGEINHLYEVPWQQAKQMDDDAIAIMGGKPMLVPGEEGLRDIRIVEAIYKAAATGKRVAL